MFRFHSICGTNIKLSDDRRSAQRLNPKTDFNNALLFSDKILETNVIFQVQLQKKISVWNGGIEIGVTKVCPDSFGSRASLPQIATELKNGTWLMSSHTIIENGEILAENYGYDLEKLKEGDTVGLMRTSVGSLIYFVNGTPQGVAVSFIPQDVYAIVSLYGKCSQISLVDVQVSDQCTNTTELISCSSGGEGAETDGNTNSCNTSFFANSDNSSEHDKLRFHEKCGPLVKLSSHNRAAERIRPMEEFNNAVVLTHRPLKMNELFQVRIDLLIQKWSGSLEFGLTGHSPDHFELPATLTVVKNTIIMSGQGVLHNGRATNSQYTHFNLDQLKDGDRVGVMLKSNGEVHYFVNGSDQGSATTGISSPVWGCLNLYGVAAKVTIVDRNEREEHNLRVSVRSHSILSYNENLSQADDQPLLFSPNCGFHAAVVNGGLTAHRPNAKDDFNHGVVLTNRTLKPNELFEVRLDKLVTKWAGSIEVGVTTHSPLQLDYPCTMTNVRSGTWILTGNGIMRDGVSIIEDFGQSLDRLKVGDTVGVMRKGSGNLHFYVNSEDMGCAATNVPPCIYGVVDLYGQAAGCTIVTNNQDNNSSLCPLPSDLSDNYENSFNSVNTELETSYLDHSMRKIELDQPRYEGDDLRFHILCGKNARVSNNGLTVSRPNALNEFNAAVAISNRELRNDELFEVVIERMVDRWSGNLEVGITTIKPTELEFPNTMTDIDHSCWILSGSNFMISGNTITQRYNCNLDSLTVGSRVGIIRKSDATLHFLVNGQDKGPAAVDIPKSVYAVVDLYGQCQQVSILKSDALSLLSSQIIESLNQPLTNDLEHRFSNCCGKNIVLKTNNLEASRVRHYTNSLVFSSCPLEVDEIFEVRLVEITSKWAGCLVCGVTTLKISDDFPASLIPHSISSISSDTWFVAGSQVRKNNVVIRDNYCMNLHRLCVGDRVGVCISTDRCLHFYINGEDMGVAAYFLPKVPIFAAFDIFGKAETIAICSSTKNFLSPSSELPDIENEVNISNEAFNESALNYSFSFDPKLFGKNIELKSLVSAARTAAFNYGIVITNQILQKEQLFEIKITTLNPKWTSSLMIGVVDSNVDRMNLPSSARQLRNEYCVISEDSVFRNGYNVKHPFGQNLDKLQEGDTIGIFIDDNNDLHLVVNNIDQGIACEGVDGNYRGLIDLYGKCEEIRITDGNIKSVQRCASSGKNDQFIEENTRNHCEYLNACVHFFNTLCLPEPYFPTSEPIVCFCSNCYKSRGPQNEITQHGEPPADYTIPYGWVKFPISINVESENPMMSSSTCSLNNILTKWHIAFFGLRISHVREILDVGQLFSENSECESYREDFFFQSKQKDEEGKDGAVLIFSPCTDYAAIPEFSPSHEIKYNNKKWLAKVVFQILVKPSSYKVGAASFPSPVTKSKQNFDGIDIGSIEWATKEERSTHISALLVHLNERV